MADNARTMIDKNWNLLSAMTAQDGQDIVFRLLGYMEKAEPKQMTKLALIEYICKTASELQAKRK